MARYRRDKCHAEPADEAARESKAERTMQKTRETIGALRTVLDELSTHLDELDHELAPHQKRGYS